MHRYSAFVIRLLTDDESNTLLEGQVEQVGGQEAVHFRDVSEALTFISDSLQGDPAPAGAGGRSHRKTTKATFPSTYAASLDHLLAELSVLDLRLLRQVQRIRRPARGSRLEDDLRGMLISEEQVDSILTTLPVDDAEEQEGTDPLAEAIAKRTEEIAAARSQALSAGIRLRLEQVRSLYGLNTFEMGVVLLCIAPELDPKYQNLYAYIHDDVGKKRPTVDLALTLFSSSLAERLEHRSSFTAHAPLVRNGLIQITDDSTGRDASTARFLRLEPRIVEHLLGSDTPDGRLVGAAQLKEATASLSDVVVPADTLEQAQRIIERVKAEGTDAFRAVVQFLGPAGTGKTTLAEAVCRATEKRLLAVDCRALVDSENPETLVTAALREALLQDAAIFWSGAHVLLAEGLRERALLAALDKSMEEHSGIILLSAERAWRPDERPLRRPVFTLELQQPSYAERLRLWQGELAGLPHEIAEDDLTVFAGKFRLSGGQIRQVSATARDLAMLRSASGETAVSPEDLHRASRWHSNQRLGLMAQKIEPRYTMDDIVLPRDQKALLSEIGDQFRHAPVVYDQWGFLAKTVRGKGLSALFAGPSGTGKTMAAEIIAREIGLDLYRIDLAGLVSKYIGETEKNLDKVFREAEDSNAVLFFDEADALFGKRSEVKDAHDRYANIEVSYLLQKMEDYEGIVILATNFRKNMDDAFMRRLSFAVDFPFPDEQYRLEIWRRVFPENAPLAATSEFPFLARQFKVAGGSIKNIAVTSAFLAAADAGAITMRHIIWAAKREYQKMGKLLQESDFGPYFDLVKSETGTGGKDAR